MNQRVYWKSLVVCFIFPGLKTLVACTTYMFASALLIGNAMDGGDALFQVANDLSS